MHYGGEEGTGPPAKASIHSAASLMLSNYGTSITWPFTCPSNYELLAAQHCIFNALRLYFDL